jgi:DNA polymerase III subunit delta
MPQTIDAFFRSLKKGELAPVYYLYGPEDVLKEEAVAQILDRVLDPGLKEFNFDQRSAAVLEPEEIHSLCNTLPMMAERRVVVLRDVEAWKRKTRAKAEFLRYLERPSPETVVVLIQGSTEEAEDSDLARGASTLRLDPLSPTRAEKWVLRRAGHLGLTLTPEAASHLVRAVGTELAALRSEMAKLASLPVNEALTPERLGELVGVRHGETVWDWREAVLQGQAGDAVALLEGLLAQPGVSGVKLVAQLGTALVGVGIARSAYDGGRRGHALEDFVFKSLLKNRPIGVSGYKEESARWSRWAPEWPLSRIRAGLRAAGMADQALKNTTVSDEQGLLTDLVLQLTLSGKEEGAGRNQSGNPGSTRVVRIATKAVLLLVAISGLIPTSAYTQTDPRLVDVIRSAQEGRGDSARVKVQRMLAATPTSDSLYPQILYTQAMVAGDAGQMRRQLQRVAVEYATSSWADDALLRLVQLDYASGNLGGAARNLERLRRDYPGSTLMPQISYWAARTYFDQKNPGLACRWLADGLAASRGNVEQQNQLGYLNQRCPQVAVDSSQPPKDSATVVASGKSDTVGNRATADSNSAMNTPPATAEPAPPAGRQPAAARPDSSVPAPAVRTPNAPSATRFRVQITAVGTASAADVIVSKLKVRGLSASTVAEGGLYKVRVGSYASRAEAAAALPEIKAKVGGSPFVVAEP